MTLAGLLIWQFVPTAPEGPIESIAILPFKNGTQGDEADYLCIEIPASLSARLSGIERLRVVPTGNLTRFQNEEVEPRSAAAQLEVHAILQGWLTQIGEELSVRVELSDARHDRVLWGESYHRPFTDVFEIQDEIAGRMAAVLRLRLTPEQEARVSHRPTQSIAAYQAYLKGEFLRGQPLVGNPRLRESTLSDAVASYRRAIEEDPAFALAYVGLFRAYAWVGFDKTSAGAWSEARKAAQKALDLDSSRPQVHLVAAAVRAFWDHDWKGAESEYTQATQLGAVLSLEPSYPEWLLWMGRHEEALEVIEKGTRLADPLSDGQSNAFGYRYYWARRFDRALEIARKTEEPWLLALCLQAVGEQEEAFAALLSVPQVRTAPEAIRTQYERAFNRDGLKGFWKLFADQSVLRMDKPYDIAATYAFAGEGDLAYQWLEKAYELPIGIPFLADARFDSLRDDPRFEQLLRKLKLPEEVIAIHLKANR